MAPRAPTLLDLALQQVAVQPDRCSPVANSSGAVSTEAVRSQQPRNSLRYLQFLRAEWNVQNKTPCRLEQLALYQKLAEPLCGMYGHHLVLHDLHLSCTL